MRRVTRVAPFRPGRSRVRWIAWAVAAVAALGVVQLPSVAQAAPTADAPTGLHDGMMPSTSPDAQSAQSGLSADTQATTQAASGPVVGVDVSSHQHPNGAAIDWNAVAASGQSFAMVKATELYTDSTTGQPVLYTNPYLQGDLTGAHNAGLIVGTYAFLHPENDPIAQADDFAAAIGTLPLGSLPPVADLETSGGLDVAHLTSWTQAFLDRLEYLTGIIPMIYTSPNYWKTYYGNSPNFARYPLWEAHYTTAPSPALIGGWNGYNLWQFTDSQTIAGIPTLVDQDQFNSPVRSLLSTLSVSSGMTVIESMAQSAAPLIGAPVIPITCGLVHGGCAQQFANDGSIYWTPFSGGHVISGGIRLLWAAMGWEWNLGYPVTDQDCTLVSGGCDQSFSNGASIYWSPATGAHEVRGGIGIKYGAMGAQNSWLGYPVTGQLCGLRDGGCAEHFQGGSIYWSPATGSHFIGGGIRDTWAAMGYEWNLGYPLTDQICPLRNGGCAQHFQYGSLYWSAATGVHEIRGGIRDAWIAQGLEAGALAYPVTGQFCGLRSGGCGQHFQGGSIYWSPATGARIVSGGIRNVWAAAGWETGRYGYPTGNAYLYGAYWVQSFQGGTITVRA